MKIGFYVLVLCYVVFVDWSESVRQRRPILLGSRSEAMTREPVASVDSSPVALVSNSALVPLATTLIVGNLVAGFAGIDSYP